jgi:hypothetical protein
LFDLSYVLLVLPYAEMSCVSALYAEGDQLLRVRLLGTLPVEEERRIKQHRQQNNALRR